MKKHCPYYNEDCPICFPKTIMTRDEYLKAASEEFDEQLERTIGLANLHPAQYGQLKKHHLAKLSSAMELVAEIEPPEKEVIKYFDNYSDNANFDDAYSEGWDGGKAAGYNQCRDDHKKLRNQFMNNDTQKDIQESREAINSSIPSEMPDRFMGKE